MNSRAVRRIRTPRGIRSRTDTYRRGAVDATSVVTMTTRGRNGTTATDMNVLVRPDHVVALADAIKHTLGDHGATGVEVVLTGIESACEPDNMLVAEYQQRFDTPPIGEQVHRLRVTACWPDAQGQDKAMSTADVTRVIAACLPGVPDGSPGLWFGQTSTLRSSE